MTIRTGSKIRTYSELITFPTFEERYEYLKLNGIIGENTFGCDRIFNQMFYAGKEWQPIRDKIIVRDNGCDLGVVGYEIMGSIYVHHITPISIQDIKLKTKRLLDPENLICVSYNTHCAIHYGNKNSLPVPLIKRTPNDTCPWRH